MNESVGGWFREGLQRGVRYVFDRAGELRQRRDVRHNGEKEDFSWGDNRQLVAVRKGERLVFKQTAEETRWFYWQGDALVLLAGRRAGGGNGNRHPRTAGGTEHF
ncbi:hypothetical protein [Klebsiella aerogenes]|uniref:hypothetical protein n=1 Tax=Klebsiella aerogenes TaxID=548 RepID=UPI003AF911D0